MTDWDLNKYYWPKERVLRWWELGWDWDSLQKKPCKFLGDGKTLADYYGEEFSKEIEFDDPRPGKTGKISEWGYWHDGKDRWLTEFAGKRWTPYHLPLYDPTAAGFLPSPKHHDYKGAGKWDPADYQAFTRGLIVRLNGRYRKEIAPLVGIVVPPKTDLSCRETTFRLDFSDTLWGANVNLENMTVGREAVFTGATFGIAVKFSHTTFGDSTDFSEATFGNDADFFTAKLGYKTNFQNTRFGANTDFNDTVFMQHTDFRKAIFDGDANFQCNQTENILDEANFENVTFKGNADFTGRKFTSKTEFSKAIFHGVAKFYDAELPEETYFTLDDAHWPLPPKPKGRAEKNCDCSTPTKETPSSRFEEYEKAFCRLKKIQQGHEARTAEHFFYKLELKARMCRDDDEIRWPERLSAWAYGVFSDYGESIGRPIFCLLVSWGITTTLAYFAALPPPADFSWSNLGFAATAAWHNLVPGGFVKDVFSACHDESCRSYRYGEWSDHLLTAYGFWLYVVTGLFAAFNLALWFLFGLALKRRFQIK